MTKETGGPASEKTLRDYFAGQALVGLLSGEQCADGKRQEDGSIKDWKVVNVEMCYEFADAMLKERTRHDAE